MTISQLLPLLPSKCRFRNSCAFFQRIVVCVPRSEKEEKKKRLMATRPGQKKSKQPRGGGEANLDLQLPTTLKHIITLPHVE